MKRKIELENAPIMEEKLELFAREKAKNGDSRLLNAYLNREVGTDTFVMEADEDALDAFKEVMATMIFASMVMLAIQSIENDVAKNAALN